MLTDDQYVTLSFTALQHIHCEVKGYKS